MELEGKVAVITGAGRGIGKATALKFAQAGASVVLASRTATELEEVEKIIKALGRQAYAIPVDVTKRGEVVRFAEQVKSSVGKVDILLNSAGIGVIRPFMDTSEEEFDRLMDTNAKGTFFVTQAIAPIMLEAKKGHVVNIPGILGKAAMLNASAYSASKWAVTGMTRSMALDLKRFGIKFTLMHFGGVDSPFWDNIDGMRVQRDKMLNLNDAANAIFYAVIQPDALVPTEIVLQPESHQL
jgi:NAD(P)-dependent dehydrogenase (short-subunit alcohol dehydrogenase family)